MPIEIQVKQVSKSREQKPDYNGEIERTKVGENSLGTEFYGWIAQVENLEDAYNNIEENRIIVYKPKAVSEKQDVDFVVKIFDQRL